MNLKNSLTSAIRALRKNKLRTFLTSLGVIIGVGAVIAIVGVGNSVSVSIKEQVRTFGTNSISVFSYNKKFSIREIEEIQQLFPQIKYITPIITEDNAFLKYKGFSKLTRCFGVNNDYFKILEWQLTNGSYFSKDDIQSLEKVLIIGHSIRNQLFPQEDPIGKVILINNIPFRVIGVLDEMGVALSGRDQDNPVFAPYTTVEVKLLGKKDTHMINAAVNSEEVLDYTEKMLRRYMKRVYSLEESLTFRITTSKKQLEVYTKVTKSLQYLLIFIASISLIVGGIGIMNIMLVSVSERTREIGIRMAIGAKGRDIMMQFLVESIMLSSFGGIIGIMVGLFVYLIFVLLAQWIFIFSLLSIIISFLFAASVGILFGLYPAWKAANLNPIDALRHE